MKFGRSGVALSLLTIGALAVSSCGAGGLEAAVAPAGPQTVVQCAGKPELRASGSIVQQDAIEQFGYAYIRACPGHSLDYNASGSAAGVDAFIAGETDLAGSDTALDPSKGQPERAADRCASPAWHLPVVFSPIAITYRLTGVNSLTLDGPTAAKIFNGMIGSWDHPAIKALNTDVNLPSLPIHVVFRSDRSSTTAGFQRYLEGSSDGVWTGGAADTFSGGFGEGAVGGNGTSAALQATDGSITYGEWSFAVGKRLPIAQIIPAAGSAPVTITAESVGKTIAGAKFAGQGNDLVLDTLSFYRPAETGAYPIVLPIYEVVCSKYPDAETGAATKAFLQAAIGPGQDGLDQYGSIPLPASFRSTLLTAVNAIS